MAFTLFNTSIDYQGQDLHMLRNGERFPFHSFFNSSVILNYTFRLLGDETTLSYSNIQITEDNDKVWIKADPYTNTAHKRIDNFFITVSYGNESCTVLVHVHNAINKFWASPEKLSFRKGMSVKFGLLASFTDGNYADLSFYPSKNTKKTIYTPIHMLNFIKNQLFKT